MAHQGFDLQLTRYDERDWHRVGTHAVTSETATSEKLIAA
jgi:hypothetical protein